MKYLKILSSVLLLIIAIATFCFFTADAAGEDDKDDHAGHDHAKQEKEDDHADEDKHDDHDEAEVDEHEGHDHAEHKEDAKKEPEDEHAGHDHDAEAEEEGLIALTAEQKKEIGLTVKKAGTGSLHKELTLTGEVVLNGDSVVHLVPRVPGIVLKVNKSLGDKVTKGEVLAVLDSAELGEAKSDYFEKFNDVGCCLIDLERARILEKNTKTVIKDLKVFPTLAELRKKDYGDIGAYRSKLLASYADFLSSKQNFERSQKLYDKKVISESEFENQQNGFEKGQAEFFSKLHEARFAIKQHLFEKEREQRVKEFKLKTAERKLRILGLSNAQIKALQTEILIAKSDPCKDKDCKNCKAQAAKALAEKLDPDDDFSKFEIIAPEKGTITVRHITRGEKLDDESEVFTIADLSTVWIDLQVPARDIPLVVKGSSVIIESAYSLKAEGKIKLVAPVINVETRTVTARIVLDNPKEQWKTGSFVTGHIRLSAKNIPLVVPRNAVQNVNGKDVIFIPEGKGFEAINVKTGRSDRKQIEILSGLKPGMKYVDKGAFELKAIKITSNLDSHAGHGH